MVTQRETATKIATFVLSNILNASVVYWSEFLATDPEDPGSILGPTRFSEK
jgi:hypothetical protein